MTSSSQPELWDIYDEKRQRTGRVIARGDRWGNEKYHLIVHVCLFDKKGRLLIQKRAHEKQAWADLWDVSAGGSAVSGEDSRAAAERETFEELGIRLDLSGIRPHFSINYARGFDDFYLLEHEVAPEELTLQKEEVACVQWASIDEVRLLASQKRFVPYFPALLELLWQVKGRYDGAICQTRGDAKG